MPPYILFAVPFLALVTTAIPTPARPRGACTTVQPDILQFFAESEPSTSFPNLAAVGGHFIVSQDAGRTNRVYQAAAFTGIPAGAWGCTLNLIFPPTSTVTVAGAPILNVSTLARGQSALIVDPNNWTWDDLNANPSHINIGLFGTVGEIDPGIPHTINSERCPTDLDGGGTLAYLFSIADWIEGESAVYFNDLSSPTLSGVYLTYNC